MDEKKSDIPLKPVEIASASAKVRKLLSGNEGKENHAALDGFMMSKLNPLASAIVKACLPGGLAVTFPTNVSMPHVSLFILVSGNTYLMHDCTDLRYYVFDRCKGFYRESVAGLLCLRPTSVGRSSSASHE